jgi:hypothetical protein
MKKTPRQKKSSLVKKIIIAVVGLLLIAGAVQAYQKLPGKKSLSIINSMIEQFDNSKEDAVGCCLPQCGESGKMVCEQSAGRKWVKGSCENLEECQIGCCQFDCKIEQMAHDSCDAVNGEWNMGECVVGCCEIDVAVVETLPHKTCSECTGGSWKEGQIYTSYMTMEDSDVFGGNQANWEMKMSLKACGENPVTANWTGAWEWLWTVQFPNGEYKTDHAGDVTNFTPDSGGRASFNIGAMSAQAKVSRSKMHIVYPMPNLGDIILDGPIIKE